MATSYVPQPQPMFRAIILDDDLTITSAQVSTMEGAVEQMNMLMDEFKYADNGTKVEIDAKYNTQDYMRSVWAQRQPGALALRVLHVREYGRTKDKYYKIIGKVVMS